MKFLIDAQLPQRMKAWFSAAGCDVLDTWSIPHFASLDVATEGGKAGRVRMALAATPSGVEILGSAI